MGFKEAVRTCYKEKYITFSGRATRSEYWYFSLFYFLGLMLLSALLFAVEGVGGIEDGISAIGMVLLGLGLVFYLGSMLPLLSATVRRLHDRNLSGWWLLASVVGNLIPFVGLLISLVFIVIMIMKGTDGDNKFGPDPLRGPADASVFS